MRIVEIHFLDVAEDSRSIEIIEKVMEMCFIEEKLKDKNLFVNVTLTNAENIHRLNKEHRNVDKPTDVLSFPMFEKDEIADITGEYEDILGDVVISVEQVERQASEYGHSFERELAYMVVHSFYHLLGYDHMEEEDKFEMRTQEEKILGKLQITR